MHFDDLRQALGTVIAVPVTPFDADGQVDLGSYRRLINTLTAGGISVVTPNGNTGEFYSLTLGECQAAVETAAAAAGEAVVVAGVGYAAATAVEMAQVARQAGASAVMIHQIIHPYRSPAGWVAYHRKIAAAVPELGVVPYVRDGQVTAAMLTEVLDTCPNVVGIKYAVADPLLFANLVQAVGADRMAWVCGIAESWAPFYWVGGARGFTSGLVNVHIPRSLDMLQCLQAGRYDQAMQRWAELKPFEDLRARRNGGNNVSVVKEAMAQRGLSARTVRPPISELPESERAEVAAVLAAWGA